MFGVAEETYGGGIRFQKVVIVGVGLIGGSLGLVLKQKQLAQLVVGVGRRLENLEQAVQLQAIDRFEMDPGKAVLDADLVVLATPVETYVPHLQDWGKLVHAEAIVTDVGSVKGALVEQVEALLPKGSRFVGGHPIAGREKSGVAYASVRLFEGARCVLTPTRRTDPQAQRMIGHLWESAGSKVSLMDPFVHDRVLGAVSHLPHLVAFSLMHTLQDLQGDLGPSVHLLEYSGGGLRDTTRIAASSPEMWRDICLANQRNLTEMIDAYILRLRQIRDVLEAGDSAKLEEMIAQAKDLRERLP